MHSTFLAFAFQRECHSGIFKTPKERRVGSRMSRLLKRCREQLGGPLRCGGTRRGFSVIVTDELAIAVSGAHHDHHRTPSPYFAVPPTATANLTSSASAPAFHFAPASRSRRRTPR